MTDQEWSIFQTKNQKLWQESFGLHGAAVAPPVVVSGNLFVAAGVRSADTAPDVITVTSSREAEFGCDLFFNFRRKKVLVNEKHF